MFYGGKGGVGKTTCAAARAVAEGSRASKTSQASQARTSRVLVVSTDPAHSLGDAFAVRLSASPRPVAPGLDAVELDAPRSFRRWLTDNRAALGEVFEHGTWLDRDDVEALLDLSLPGIDELAGMLEIARFAASGYHLIVVDTAPTGHTLRLLASPETMSVVADVLDALQEEHRVIREQLARVGHPEAADRLIATLAGQAGDMREMLRDARRTAFHWVTLPESLALAESEDGVAALTRAGISVAEIVVNRVLPDDPQRPPCPICAARRASERAVIAAIEERLGRGRTIRVIPAELHEPQGVKALRPIGRTLTVAGAGGRTREGRRKDGGGTWQGRGALAMSLPDGAIVSEPEAMDVFVGPKLLFVGGKGGVGKTTVAAAAAIRLARAHPRKAMLLLSTDPAHSLADVLNARSGDREETKRVPGAPRNLTVRELDAAKALAARRAHLESALDEIASTLGADVATARSDVASGLMDLAPPGIDELFALLEVVKLLEGEYAFIVIDTAPTGHALRLLEMPEAARGWVQVVMRMLLKYRSVVRPGQLAAELVDLSKSIRELQAVLRDPSATRFIVVTRAGEVPRAETERLLERLRRLKLSAPAVVVNAMTLAPGRCRRCRATAAMERQSLAVLKRSCGGRNKRCAIIETPLSAPPPRGVKALERWARHWISTSGGSS